jgi:hypothetical protein
MGSLQKLMQTFVLTNILSNPNWIQAARQYLRRLSTLSEKQALRLAIRATQANIIF